MRLRVLTIGLVLATAALFGGGVPLVRLFEAFQALTVAFSIMIAALLVRLNRGMPSLEWSSLEPAARATLTARIVDLSIEYSRIVAIDALALALLVGLLVIGKDPIMVAWSDSAQRGASAVIGAIVALSALRMAYVIWRDCDIVRLQKTLIDGAAVRDSIEEQVKRAAANLVSIRSAGLRKVESPPPRAWGE